MLVLSCQEHLETTNLPVFADKAGGIYEVESIIGKKKIGKTWHFLVKWSGYADFDNTWEPLKNVRHLTDMIKAAPIVE